VGGFSEGVQPCFALICHLLIPVDLQLMPIELEEWLFISVPDPPDPHVFGPPGSGSTSQRYGSGSGSFYHHAKIVRKTLIPNIL
jgi:hypothetical protein